MKYKDYYEILGVAKDASSQAIKSAYRKLARKYHPDVNKAADAQAKFKDINEAYEVLGDESKRKRYDQLGSSWSQGADFTPPPGFEGFNFSNFSQGSAQAGGFSDFFSAIFGDIMSQQTGKGGNGGFSGFSSNFGGGRSQGFGGFSNFGDFSNFANQGAQSARNTQSSRQKAQKEENLDIIQNVFLTVDDLINHPKKTVTISAYQQCAHCHGSRSGFCSNCAGTGVEKITKNITFQVPKSVVPDQKIRFKGEGKQDAYGKSGDVYLIVKIKDENYEIQGFNLIKDVELLPYEAVLGCEKQIETPNGKIKIKIPKNTSSGKKLRLKELGLTKKDNSKGDLEARIKIVLPKEISPDAKKLYEKLKEINS